jgi:elongation factor G
MLFAAGAIGRKGSVADGTTVGDGSAEARARQMSTEVSAAGFAYQGLDFTVLDCPGSIEFVQEAYSAVLGCDAAVVVVEPVLERMIVIAPLLQFLDSHAIPHFVFVNKMDRAEVRYQDILQTLRQISARPVVPHQYAIGAGEDLVGYIDLITEEAHAFRRGQASDVIPVPPEHRELEQAVRREMLETLADFDDDLLELLLEDKEPSQELILGDLRKTLGADQVVPVFLGVADQDMGVRRLLEALAHEAPEPLVRVASLGLEAEGPPIVQVLKNLYLPHAGKLSLVRVWRGSVRDGTTFGDMRVGGVYRLFGSQQQNVGSAEAGEIVALARLDGARTGAALGANEGELPRPPAPRPMYAFAVSAVNRADEVKLSGAFAKLTDEDPALLVEHARETHQTLLWGQGEIHLRVALERLKNKYNVEVEPQAPRTPYRESIRKGVQAHGRHKKQSGGHGQFGDVKIEIRPLGRGEGFQFENKIVGGTVPRQFIPAVEAGAREYLQRGPLGFPVVDIAVTLNDGQFHSVDSNELSFKLASAQALKEGLPQCEPVLLEPILSVTISVPADYTAKALQLVSGKRGQILGYAAKPDWSGWDEIEAQIPQGEMHDLIVTLRSLSQGTGFFDWAYDHLQEVPDRLAQTIVDKHRDLAA